jgi:hypothetical protein
MSSMTGATGYQSPSGATGNKIPKGYRQGQIQQFDPKQMELYGQQFQHVGPESYLSRLAGGDQSQFEEMEAPALRQFNELQGGIASRFSGQGMGGRKSSGFQNTMNAASQDFAGQLQAQRQSLQQKAIQDLMGMSGQLLQQRPYEQFMVEKPQKQSSGWGGILGAGLGAAGGFFGGGPGGALSGAQLGHAVGSSF